MPPDTQKPQDGGWSCTMGANPAYLSMVVDPASITVVLTTTAFFARLAPIGRLAQQEKMTRCRWGW